VTHERALNPADIFEKTENRMPTSTDNNARRKYGRIYTEVHREVLRKVLLSVPKRTVLSSIQMRSGFQALLIARRSPSPRLAAVHTTSQVKGNVLVTWRREVASGGSDGVLFRGLV